MKLHVVVDEQPHALDDVGSLGDLPLILDQVEHDRLHDVEQEIALRADVVVKAADLDAHTGGDVPEGGGLEAALVEKVEGYLANLVGGVFAGRAAAAAGNSHQTECSNLMFRSDASTNLTLV